MSSDRPRRDDADAQLDDRFECVATHAGGEGVTLQVHDRSAGGATRALRLLSPDETSLESCLLASLRHPAIPAVLEVGTLRDGRHFVLREWLPGSAPERLPNEPTLLRRVLRDLLEVLAFVHLRGVLHLDLKPRNLLLQNGDVDAGTPLITVLDFGLAVRSGQAARGGTPFFAAPELLIGARPDERADLFSVGAMVVQALAERPIDLARFVRHFPGQPFLAAAGIDAQALPEPFASFVARCVSRRPDRRFVDAQAALEFLIGDGGRPGIELLRPDPCQIFADLLPTAPRQGRDLVLTGSRPATRRSLALHLAAECGDVRLLQEDDQQLRLVRGEGLEPVTWQVPSMPPNALARHLRNAVGLSEPAAADTAQWLLDQAADRDVEVEDLLLEQLAAGELLPNGPRFTWPAAAAGRLAALGTGGQLPATPTQIHAAAAAGRRNQAFAGWHRLVHDGDPCEPEARRALAAGLLDAGEPGAALPLCLDAPLLRAQGLLETGALREAAAVLDQAVPEQPEQAARRDRLRAQLLSAQGRHDEAIALLQALPPGWREAVTLAATFEQCGRLDECEVALATCRQLSAQQLPFAVATTRTIAGHVARNRGRLVEAQQEFAAALGLFRSIGHLRHTATTLLNLGVTAKDRGEHREALELLREARTLFASIGDQARVARTDASIGIAALARGDAATAIELLEPAAERLATTGDLATAGLALMHAARAHAQRGAPDLAEEVLARAGVPGSARLQEAAQLAIAAIRTARASPPTRPSSPMPEPTDASPLPTRSTAGPSRELFRAFLSVNRHLARSESLEQAMQHLVATAVMLTGARHGYLLVVHADGMRREVETGERPSGGAFSRSLAHRAMQRQRALSAADALADRELSDAASVRNLEVRSAICAPFRTALGIDGAIYVEHAQRSDVFAAADVEVLEVLADQAAIAVDRMTREQAVNEELRQSRQQAALADVHRRRRASRLLGSSEAMRTLRDEIQRLAPLDIPVLVSGETGTGKELVARALHQQSRRKQRPFVAENCAALPEELLERELFGHVRGAFTGADTDKPGLLELADQGTLFLDEVGDMSPALQAKLLRALQEQTIRRVGGTETLRLDLRIVAATHKDLRALIAGGRFRQDLYYRLAGVELRLPPLRERGDDVVELAETMLQTQASRLGRTLHFSPVALAAMRAYPWPGNVRELEHVIARAALLAGGEEIVDLDLPHTTPSVATSAAPRVPPTLDEVERLALVEAMQYCSGDKTKAARVLGISRTTLYGKLRRHGLAT